jgi:hypothetical protein
VPDSQYVVARSVLLDALEALGKQREAVVVVGAQAIYLHTGHIELAVPEFRLMVPEAVGESGRRAARLPGHAKEVAGKARGLEAALVDKATTTIGALDAEDSRSFDVRSCTRSPNESSSESSVAWTTKTLSTFGGCCRQSKPHN